MGEPGARQAPSVAPVRPTSTGGEMTSQSPLEHAGRLHDVLVIAAVTAGATVSGLAVAIVMASAQPGDQYVVAAGGALAITVPVAVGIGLWRAGEYVRFGRLLVVWGLLNCLAVLSFSSSPLAYSAGRVGVWVVEPLGIAALLAFPLGVLHNRLERGLVIVISATCAMLFLPTAFLVEHYPEPSLWATCLDNCPENAFMLVATEPGFVDAWVRPVREAITIAVFLAVVGVFSHRFRTATPLWKRMLAPVLLVALVRGVALAGFIPLRQVDPGSVGVDVLSWIFVLSVPALALAFLIGVVRSRLLAGTALEQLALQLRRHSDERDLRDMLASVLHDPSLELAYWIPDSPGSWVNTSGEETQLRTNQPGRSVTEIYDQGRRVAAVLHDESLRAQRGLVEAAGALALAALENQRLKTQLDLSLESLRESRARIQAAADSERRRIERDLHDGAQQRLAALRIRLELAAEAVRGDPDRAAALLRELGGEVEEALDDVRALARGIFPPVLADRGLADALREAARRAPIPTTVEIHGPSRYPPKIEAAVYFCCLEALQNIAKHAGGATSASVSVDGGDVLRFDVVDDGPGFDQGSPQGSGLTNMRDRIRAVGGALTITSTRGEGTHVAGFVPLT
jgi:signal transduction histidine kinase